MKAGNLSFAGSRRDAIFYALVAVFLLAAAWVVAGAAGPFEADPDYIYLLNGLELLTLRSPAYFTHPGTPVEIMAAIVIAATWLVSSLLHGFSDLQDRVLSDPGFYMGWIDTVFVVAIAGSLVFFVMRVRNASERLFPAIVGSLSILLPLSPLLAVHRITPEPMLLAGGMVLAGLLASMAFASNVFPETKRFAIAVGAAIGFCIAVKATAAPLLITILTLRSNAARKTAFVASVFVAVILTLPVASHYLEMTLWYVGLFTHQGGYGNGAVGVPGLGELLADASALVTAMPETFICLGLYAAVILAHRTGIRRLPGNAIHVLTFCVLIIAIDLLAVLKQPEVRYTIPTVAFLCLGNAIVAQTLFGDRRWGQAALIAALALWGARIANARTEHLAAIRDNTAVVLRKAGESGCLLAPYYETNLVQYNLFFGNGWTQYFFRDRLVRLYPDFVSFNIGAQTFEKFSGLLTDEAAHALFARQKCVYLVGPVMARYGDAAFPKSALSLVAQSPGGPREAIAIYALQSDWPIRPPASVTPP